MFKFFKWLLLDQFMLGMGGGGGGGTTTSTGTTYQTNIPEYAQPYVETMLGATQQQLFDMSGSEITGFKPYKPYSTNLDDYTAGFQPLQEQAMRNTGQLQTPGQFGDATTLAGVAGLGSLGAGQQYARNVTDPSMMQSYMSPYQQNVTDIAKMNAVREAQMAQNAQNLGAARQGTYGGARQLLAQTEREKNLLSNLSNIQAQGSQSAFDRAMQAQQFGSTLGMQGYGQAGQAASTLGQLGGAQLGAQKEIIGLQSQMGAQQQALEQQKINQAIQEYATAQQYPIMQLGVMSNMLRGLPMQATQTQTYAAAPNPLTQGIGTVGALGSLANVFKGSSTGREGGLPSEFKPATGIKSYRRGGVSDNVEGILYDMSPNDLEEYIKETSSPLAKRLAQEVLRDKVGKASGGIIAFKEPNEENNQGVVKDEQKTDPQTLRDRAGTKETLGAIGDYASALQRDVLTLPGRALSGAYNTVNRGVRSLGIDTPYIPGDYSSMAPNLEATQRRRASADSAKVLNAEAKQSEIDYDAALVNKPNAVVKGAIPPAAPAAAPPPPAGIKAAPPPPGGTAPAPAPAAAPADKTAAATPDAKSVLDGLPPELKKFFGKYLDKTPETVEEKIAKKEKYLGPDEYTPKERARLMAAKSNIQDEKFREFNMNAALFFAKMATTPGSVAFAALTALKNTIPTFVASDKEKGKLFREIDKGLVDLDKAARLEKSGNYDAAEKLVAETAKNQLTGVGKILAFHQAEHVEKIRKEGKIAAAKIGRDATSDLKERDLYRKVEEGIARDIASEGYQDLLKTANMSINEKSSQVIKDKVAKAQTELNAIKLRHEERRRTAKLYTGDVSTTNTAPLGGSLTPDKDGSFTYKPKT